MVSLARLSCHRACPDYVLIVNKYTSILYVSVRLWLCCADRRPLPFQLGCVGHVHVELRLILHVFFLHRSLICQRATKDQQRSARVTMIGSYGRIEAMSRAWAEQWTVYTTLHRNIICAEIRKQNNIISFLSLRSQKATFDCPFAELKSACEEAVRIDRLDDEQLTWVDVALCLDVIVGSKHTASLLVGGLRWEFGRAAMD